MLGLVLCGGGAKGSYEIGVWKALIDMDIDIDVVTGNSIGALNSALVAQGDFKKALDLWYNFDAGKMLDVEDYEDLEMTAKTANAIISLVKDFYFSGGSDALEYKKAIIKYIDEDKVRKSNTKLGVVTVELEKLKPVEISIDEMPEGELVDYIMASSALAPAVKPYEFNGKKYIDGGYYDNMPVNLAGKMGADEFVVVDLGAIGLGGCVVKDDCPENIKYILPYWNLGGVITFDREVIKKNIQQGYFDAMKKYSVFDGNAYTLIKEKTKDDFFEKFIDYIKSDDVKITKLMSKFVEINYKGIISNHSAKGPTYVDDTTCMLEILAEILEIDYLKIYSRKTLHQKIKAEIEKIELPDMKIKKVADIKNILIGIQDAKIILKFFIEELTKDKINALKMIKYMSLIYDRAFFASVYVLLYNILELEK